MLPILSVPTSGQMTCFEVCRLGPLDIQRRLFAPVWHDRDLVFVGVGFRSQDSLLQKKGLRFRKRRRHLILLKVQSCGCRPKYNTPGAQKATRPFRRSTGQ